MIERVDLVACQVDLVRGTAYPRGGPPRALTTREADLLRYLVRHASRPVSRDEILAHVWGYADAVVSRACDNAVRRLREKIEADPGRPDHVLTVHGTGYRFEPLLSEATPAGTSSVTPTPLPDPQVVARSARVLTLGGCTVDLGRRRVSGGGVEHDLTDIEAALLERLAKAGGAVVDRRTLLRDVWGAPATGGRAVDNVVRRLRAKIEPAPADPAFLLTSRGGGYRLELPEEPVAPPGDEGPLLGREVLVGQVLEALAGSRWVLLVGPAGIGKTRVARRAAALAGPAVWADLAGAVTADEATAVVGRALGIELSALDPDRVGLALRRRRSVLLVLDNLEQAPDAVAALVPGWRRAAPEARLLGTSRVRLGVEGEVAVEVGPLSDDAAIELFVQRSRAASPQFERGERDVLKALVRRLDGLPLAIEIAAGRTPVFSPADLLGRLDLQLLARPRAADPRHRTLRGAIEQSWEGLSAAEADALLQLALFRGGFVLADAEALLGPDAVDLVQALRDRSLLHGRPGPDGVRLAAWVAIREVAAERRVTDPADAGRVRRHCARLAELGSDEHLASLDGFGREAVIDHQVVRADDLADAAVLALGVGERGLAVRCAGGAVWAYRFAGPVSAGIALCDRIVAADLDDVDRARVLLWRAGCERTLDRRAAAERSAIGAAALAEGLADPRLSWSAWQTAALVASDGADRPLALERYGRALAWAERAGVEATGPGMVAYLRATIARLAGDDETAVRGLQVAAREAAPRPRLLGAIEELLAKHAWRRGRLEEARAHLDTSMRCFEACRRRADTGSGRALRVLLLYELGDHAALDRAAAEGLERARADGSPVDEGTLFAYLGTSLLLRGRLEEAGAAFDAADEVLRGTDAAKTRGFVGLRRAELFLARGDAASARTTAARAADAFRAIDEAWNTASAEVVLAEAEAGLGDLFGARARIARAVAVLREVSSAPEVALTVARAGRLAALDGDLASARACLAEARATAQGYGGIRPATELARAVGALEALTRGG